uniref:Uncharacterized protein n=1 Tax=Rhizophora mucronata TaxID=61149 RepID=A0A2P2M8F9_RHIMU
MSPNAFVRIIHFCSIYKDVCHTCSETWNLFHGSCKNMYDCSELSITN